MKIGKININPLSLAHQVGVVATAAGVLAHKLQAHSEIVSNLMGQFPGMVALVTGGGALSATITHLVKERAKDAILKAVVDSPNVVTPEGVGIPKAGE